MSNPTKPLRPMPRRTFRQRHNERRRRVSEGQEIPPLDVPMMPAPTVSDIGRRFDQMRARFHGKGGVQ